MSDANWALAENGAHIAEVSYEAEHAASTASNLLDLREDQLWITGDAPQHVTLSLSPSHPPLQYAGWHVWHDYVTNPHKVEIASGASLATMETLLLCEAKLGAGTQIWELPRAIPCHHRYVRFRITKTFESGPTYMNNIVLLENDPGANYSAYRQTVEHASKVGDNSVPGGSVAKHQGCATASPYLSSPASARRAAGGTDSVGFSPLRRLGPQISALSSGPISLTTTPRGGRRPGEARSSSRMSQLLRDLDEDIKMLKPIKTPSPAKKTIFRLAQGLSAVSADSVSEDGTSAVHRGVDSDDNESASDGSEYNGQGASAAHHYRGHHRRSRSCHRNGAARERRSCDGTSAHAEASQAPALAPASTSHLGLAAWPPSSTPPVILSAAELHFLNGGRLSALERAVASLNEAVQHQRDDLMMIKRVLLQQATERRKEAKKRYEEGKQMAEAALSLQAAVAAPPPVVSAPAPVPVSPWVLPEQRLTHRNITVGFPEEALRSYVESLLDQRLHKGMKKVEERVMSRVDNQLHDIIQALSTTLEERFAAVTPPRATTQSWQVPSSHRSFKSGGATPPQSGWEPKGLSNAPRETSRSATRVIDPQSRPQ